MERDGEPFHLDRARRPRRVGRKIHERLPPPLGERLRLEPVRADDDDPVHTDPLAHVVARSPAHDCDERVLLHEPRELRARLRRNRGVLASRHDRRENAVEVEEQTGGRGLSSQSCKQRVHRSRPASAAGCRCRRGT